MDFGNQKYSVAFLLRSTSSVYYPHIDMDDARKNKLGEKNDIQQLKMKRQSK